MKTLTKQRLPEIKLNKVMRLNLFCCRIVMFLIIFCFITTLSASAQSFTWTDNFTQGQVPTMAQCNNWSTFLNQLGKTSFVSVTISGTFDPTGIKISDPVAATKLAELLNTGTSGIVISGGHTWRVGNCGPGSCVALGVELVVDGQGCKCEDRYAIRPYVREVNWGGINTASCSGVSQTMKLEFNTGVSITPNGSTTFCEGGSVKLTASSTKCTGPLTYLWSNGLTTESITVSRPGNYSVTVSGSNGCTGISSATAVTINLAKVDAGKDVTVCSDPIQLNAVATTGNGSPALPAVTKFCLFDSPIPGRKNDCTFTADLCSDGFQVVTNKSFSETAVIKNPIELRFLMYYSPVAGVTNFTFKLNGNEIGSFLENEVTSTCTPSAAGQYPRTMTFANRQFKQFWSETSPNLLTVDIIAGIGGVYLAGITAEVVSQNEYFSWSPATGLNDASAQNPVAKPEVSTTYKVTYTSAEGCISTDEIQVKVDCNPVPTAICKAVSISAGSKCTGKVDAADFNNGSTAADGGILTFTVLPAGPYEIGKTQVVLTVTDANGKSSSCNTTVTVSDTELPSIVSPETLTIPNDLGVCSATVLLKAPEALDNCGVESISHDQKDNIFEEGEAIVTWTVKDIHGNSNTSTQKVIVTNAEPLINSVTASKAVVAVNIALSLTASFTDNNVVSATIDWNDLTGLQTVTNPKNIFTVSHTYSHAGLFSVGVTLTDACGATAMSTYNYIVVYDTNGGFVTGGGWFTSPLGAYIQKPGTTGKASFNFVAKYKKKGTVPEGETDFRFKAGDLEFESEHYEWLVVNGNTAIFKGKGEVNDQEGYAIMISVVDDNKDEDGSSDDRKGSKSIKKYDKIRVKILDPSGKVIYDNQVGSADNTAATTPIGGGSIQIHKGKSEKSKEKMEDSFAQHAWEASSKVYPNPFKKSITLQFYTSSKESLDLQLMDLSGKVMYEQNHPFNDNGSYSFQLANEGVSGLYILKIKQGKRVEFLKLLRE